MTVDTLVVEVPRRRAYGLLAFAAVLIVVAVLSDVHGVLPALVAVRLQRVLLRVLRRWRLQQLQDPVLLGQLQTLLQLAGVTPPFMSAHDSFP